MANILTDESRLARYSVMRKRKKWIEIVFDISMWAMLLAALTEIIPQFFSGVLRGIFLGELMPFAAFLAVLAGMAFFIYAIFRRDFRFLIPALVLSLLFDVAGVFAGLGALLAPLALTVSLVDSFFWLALQHEEGFPQFEISIAEEQEKKAVQEKRTEYRTLQAQVREAQEQLNPNAEMTDLLDAGIEPEHMPAHLSNYHERYRNADAVVRPQQVHGDRMDEVSESEHSDENQMDEL